MINTISAIVTTAIGLFVFWALFHYGVLTNREAVLVGAVIALTYQSFRSQGRLRDLEDKFK